MQFPSAQRPASAGQAGSAPLSGLRYFWSGRGLFRPGVVLLRSQRFRTKAWIISLSFLLPVIILAQGYFSSQREAREVALAELQGVADVRQLSKQLNELQAKAGDAARRQELLADYEKIADRSGLILDPEAPSYYAMDAALLVLPQLTDLATEQAAGKSGEATVARINDARKRLSAGLARLEAAVKTDADTLALVRGVQASLTGDKADKVEALWRAQAQMTDLLERLLHERSARISSESWRMGLLIVLSLLAGTYLFYSFALVTGGGISMIAQRIRVVAAGNLVGSSHAWGNDEFAYVARRVGEMQKVLKDSMEHITTAADKVAEVSEELQSSNDLLEVGAASSAETLSIAGKSLEDMREVVRAVDESVKGAAEESVRNEAVAVRGGEQLSAAVATMQEVEVAARRIAEIIGLIDQIAFQTNLLALNAAVEAARAGESGRGFAVVAGEVRVLAGRTANAAKDIRNLINDSVESSQRGSAQVRTSGEAIQALVASASQLRSTLADITHSTQAQVGHMKAITDTMFDLKTVSEQTTLMVGQSLTSADTMKQLSDQLREEARRFQLSADDNARL
ncbi:methyl-accepting chemotaxis protein [Roseateles sp.]|uniref:methyl-accepting chemotaxis protein n=1 Tax=Roseateles sp. TaxID=1971397 RepID=UPI00395A3BB8